MYNTSTNLYIFIIFTVTLAFELLITKLMDVSVALLWGFTIGLYFLFILYQVLIKINEDTEKNKIKELLYEIMDSINGIPIMNKNEKLIIKWDMVFKKLVDHKELVLYDKVMKMKTQHIDFYVNRYPSLLMDDSVDLKESRNHMDLNSTIRGRKKKESAKNEEELIKEDEYKRRLFINDIKGDTASFCNYNSSIFVEAILKYEYVPENAVEMELEADPNYDGFSVWLIYKENKYNVVPRIMMHRKNINKEKWFVDNIGALLNCAAMIVEGDKNYTLYVDNYKLVNYIEDMPDEMNIPSYLQFQGLKNDTLIFAGINRDGRKTVAYCEFKTNNNRFEIFLKKIDQNENDRTKNIEIEKTVAIGSSFQPVITVLEKMPDVIKNIEKTIDNQDIENIVIS